MFRRIAIVNRGEAAMRLIHAVRELAAQTGTPIETVALYTDADSTAMFVREADIAYRLGAAADRPYLDYARLERALVETGADAAWVGWGFVAEDPAFAELCERIGVTFIGPGADAMRKLGDKIGAKLIAEEVGVPVAPWSRGAVVDLDDALAAAERIGYPLMLKATAGGGGRGIRKITDAAELTEAFERTSAEAERAFGSGVVFLESLVTGARHVEVQVIADGQNAWALGVRDCSVQRRNQKIIEESASPVLTAAQAAELKASAEQLAVAVGYRGAATVEFLYHPGDKRFAFLEVNTRLQVEHPVTELTTGTDLVKLQLHVAGGGLLTGPRPAESGHAVEARLNAEDPDRDFAPSPGRIGRLELPAGPGIRVDTGIAEGDTIPADFDSMIAKIIAYGRDRDEALGRLRRAMADTTVLIEGGATNKGFVLDLLGQPEVIDGSADTGWIDRVRGEGRLISHRHSGVALAVAAIEAYRAGEALAEQSLFTTARGGRPHVQHEGGRPQELELRGMRYRVAVAHTGGDRFRVGIQDDEGRERTADVEFGRLERHVGQVTVNGARFRVVSGVYGPTLLVEVDGVMHRVSRDEGGVMRAPAPGLVVATLVAVGTEVEAGAPILVLESMKMETVLYAPFRARVRELSVSVGSQVAAGSPLIRLEPLDEKSETHPTRPAAAAAAIDLPPAAVPADAAERAERALRDLRGLLLGYDTGPHGTGEALAAYLETRGELGEAGRPVAGELDLLRAFADLAELSRSRPSGGPQQRSGRLHSPREFFHSYLQSLDVERAGVSKAFESRLVRALGHYGVTGLDRTPQLEAAVFRIFLAQNRAGDDVEIVSKLLRCWLREGPPPAGALRECAARTLEHLAEATRQRFPVVADLVHGVVFRWFAMPLLRLSRAEAYQRVRDDLRHLDREPDAPDRAERIAAMVGTAQPLVGLMGRRIGRPDLDPAPLLEVLTRRYYGHRRLLEVRSVVLTGCRFTTAAAEDRTHIAATAVDHGKLSDALDALGGFARDLPADADAVADLYVAWRDQPDPDTMAQHLRGALADAGLPARIGRITFSVNGAAGTAMHHHFTFRAGAGGWAEDRLIRGLHPHIAERLQLSRWREFDLTRLRSTDEEIHLFKAAAQRNPADERLVAMVQVRDLTPLRAADGRLVALPTLEDTLDAAVHAIRDIQAQRPARKRFEANRILLYVWPPSELEAAELQQLGDRVAPATAGAGLEEIELIVRRRTDGREQTEASIRFRLGGPEVTVTIGEPSAEPVAPLDEYRQKVLRCARRGDVYPYEITDMLAGPDGSFAEYDLDDAGVLAPVKRPKGRNSAAIVTGVVRTPTVRYPEGVTRVVLLGDPTKSLGAVSQPECRRVIAALDLAERTGVPLEWYALSSGARISMSSGTENMDWVAAALKRIVQYTQAGGEINIVVNGITVGAQPYWNAEATMLMHTRGVLVMTPDSTMVLTGKQALDFSGGVSAEDNFGIGGYDRVMGPNGQAQYWAPDLPAARDVLMGHYDHSYIAPGEGAPRRAVTADPADRDISAFPHQAEGSDFATVGEIFSAHANPDRKKPFDIRTVMRALSDQDHPVLERWAEMADAETAVVQDARVGGVPVCLVGIESRPIPRHGFPPTDGPDTYTAGTLFPSSSKKIARAVNGASANRPLVVLANLSGFDGSPESMRRLQLEYGAEIGRAVVNFRGPIVFCVISRYHGGAFVVFSKALNPNMTVLAVEGSFASVLGGAPAAAVVFSGEVDKRTAADPRVAGLQEEAAAAGAADRGARTAELEGLRATVRAEKLGEVAAEFDAVHSIQRAVEVGSVDAIVSAAQLRPRVIEAITAANPG